MKFTAIAMLACTLACITGGTVAEAANATLLYAFCRLDNCADGNGPEGPVIDVKGKLYGTTRDGGAFNGGTLFSLNLKTGKENVLHSFGSGTDGIYPFTNLVDISGTIYGTTPEGGTGSCSNDSINGCGVVYSINSKTGAETVLYSFQNNNTDGTIPSGGLTSANGMLYGTTQSGGGAACSGGCGTIYSIDPVNGAEKVIYSFQANGIDGNTPSGPLLDIKGSLYGTTFAGGSSGTGTVFSFNLQSGAETVLYSFRGGADGAAPSGGVIEASGNLYGVTQYGGKGCYAGCGTVFSLDLGTGAETILHEFDDKPRGDGYYPYGGLVETKGTLYGTTANGGQRRDGCQEGCGTVFSLDLSSLEEAVVYSLNKYIGDDPLAGLINVGGTLYGTGPFGGVKYDACSDYRRCGAVFSITP